MKKILFGFAFFLSSIFYFSEIKAQVNLPYTLTFTSNAPGWSTTGIAHDGEGGTADINGLNIQIYTTLANFNFAPGSTIVWHDNDYFSSANSNYNGITSGPDEEVTNNGVKGMVMKSADPAVNFSLQSIALYDWGYTDPFTIATYDNNTLVGSIDVTPDPDYKIITATQSNLLTPAFFNNIDEIRFYPKANPVFNLSFNNISLTAASVMPVKLISFTGKEQKDGSVLLEWATAMEQNAERFEIEVSADGTQFSKISSVPAKGNSLSESNYHSTYTGKTGASTFFRLKQIDKDGHVEYSPVILVKANADNLLITTSPNPVRNELTIASKNNSAITGVQIFSASGVLVKSVRSNNSNRLSVDMSHLSKGTYYLQIESAGATTKKMIIKE